MCPMHTPSMANLVIFIDAQTKVSHFNKNNNNKNIFLFKQVNKYFRHTDCFSFDCRDRSFQCRIGRNSSLENHQLCTQSRALLFYCQPQDDRCECGLFLHQALLHQCHHDRAGTDHHCAHHCQSKPCPVLHGSPGIQYCTKRSLR